MFTFCLASAPHILHECDKLGNRSLFELLCTQSSFEQLIQCTQPLLQTLSLALQDSSSIALYSLALAGPAPVSVLLLQLWGQDEGPSSAGGQKGLLILTHNTTFSYHQPPQWGEDLRHDQSAGGTFCHHDPVRSRSRSDQS